MTNYLYHHGIKGQKWGVRRFQNEDGSYTEAGVKRYSKKNTSQEKIENKIRKIGHQTTGEIPDEVIELGMGVTAVVASFTVQMIAQRIASKSYKNAEVNDLKNNLYKKREIKDLNSAPKLKHKENPAVSMKKVNPGYPDSGTTQNCVFCTSAMAMREKGFDVTAAKTPIPHSAQGYFETCFDLKSKPQKVKLNKLDKSMGDMPDGAYGNMTLSWYSGGGHSVFWKKENGKITIYDGQAAKIHDVPYLQRYAMNTARIQRLDDATPTKYALSVVKKGK